MTFESMMKADMKNVILDTETFAGTASYTPAGGDARTIAVMINYKPVGTIPEDFGHALHRMAEVEAYNDETEGISAVDTDDDRIDIPDMQGVERTARILSVLHKDAASWKVLVGW